VAGEDDTTAGVRKVENQLDITTIECLARYSAVELVHDKETVGGF